MMALAARGPLRVVNDQIGSPTFAPHLAAGILGLLADRAPHGTYHLAGRGAVSWYDFTRYLLDRLKIETPVEAVSTAAFPRPARRPAYSALTTAQDPPRWLPPWQEGLEVFVNRLQKTAKAGDA
jgi:dTDP-4-dehydrorhamnose reductase